MPVLSRRTAMLLCSAVLAVGGAQAASAQEKGTIYYMIPTLLDEFQTESKSAIESVYTSIGYEVVSLPCHAAVCLDQGVVVRRVVNVAGRR